MKSDNTTTVLNFVLILLSACGVIFAIMTFRSTHKLRSLQIEAAADNNFLMRMQSLAGDVAAYNQKNPDPKLTAILQSVQNKPAVHQ